MSRYLMLSVISQALSDRHFVIEQPRFKFRTHREMAEEQEIWLSQDEENEYSDSDQDFESADPAVFNLALVDQGGQEGGKLGFKGQSMSQRSFIADRLIRLSCS
jgi:hypothetical protein